jgi:16S rRNA (guanine966-N2)-methyltransferase
VKPAGRARSTVRIGAGKWKGRSLEVPASARPTSSRAREALFDILGPRIAGARFLDLFAGSGAVGFEAVSRGAARAVLVEPASEPLRRARETFEAGSEIAVVSADAARAMEDLARGGEVFDIVFADPPYGTGRLEIARLSGVRRILAPEGVLVVQTDAGAEPPCVEGFATDSRRPYGRNVFHFLKIL